jgi:hypothetical protein
MHYWRCFLFSMVDGREQVALLCRVMPVVLVGRKLGRKLYFCDPVAQTWKVQVTAFGYSTTGTIHRGLSRIL